MSALPSRASLFPVGSLSPAAAKAAFAAFFDAFAQRFAAGTAGAGTATAAELQLARDSLGSAAPGFRNRVINGDQSIDPNGGAASTFTSGAVWQVATEMFYGGSSGSSATGQQITGADGRKRYRFTGAAGNTGIVFGTRIEAKNCADLASAAATLSAKISSSSLTTINWALYYATTADTFGTRAAPTRTAIASGNFTIGSAESLQSAIATLTSAATTGLELVFTTGALLASQTVTFGDVQVEAGSVQAPAITPEVVDVSTQTVRTQRYFEVGTFQLGGAYPSAAGAAQIGTIHFKATKRAAPVMSQLAGTVGFNLSANAFPSPDASGAAVSITQGASGGNFSIVLNWSAAARLF